MSITRWGVDSSDVYIIWRDSEKYPEGVFDCLGCHEPDNVVSINDIPRFIAHLQEYHVKKGHHIPPYALDPDTYREELA